VKNSLTVGRGVRGVVSTALVVALLGVTQECFAQKPGDDARKPEIRFVVYPGEAVAGGKVELIWKAERTASPKWRVVLEWPGNSLDMAGPNSVIPDGDGKWRARLGIPINMPSGSQYRYVVYEDASGARAQTPNCTIKAGSQMVVVQGSIQPLRPQSGNWTIEVQLTFTFRGAPGDRRNGTRQVFKTLGNLEANNEGRFAFEGLRYCDLERPQYEFTVSGPGYAQHVQSAAAFPADKHTLSFNMTKTR